MTERDRVHTGELYISMDQSVLEEQFARMDLMWEYNQTRPSQQRERAALLQRMLGDCGEEVYVEAPFYANWGGWHCHFGKGVYANFGLTCVDDTVIGAGSVVTRDIPAGVVAVGNPCRVLRQGGEKDREFYFKDRKIDWEELR